MAWSSSIQSITWNSGTKITALINISKYENEKFRVRLERGRSAKGPWTMVSSRVFEKGAKVPAQISLTDSGLPRGGAFYWRLRMTHVREMFVSGPTGVTYSTPNAPTALTAERVTAGQLRVVTTGRAAGMNQFEVRAGAITQTNTTGTFVLDVDPSLEYSVQVRQRRTTSAMSYGEWSGWSAAVVVPLPMAPAAPTVTGPANGVVLVGAPAVVSWVHNSRGNGLSPQSRFELRHRLGGGEWTVIAGVGSDTQATIPALPRGEHEVQVRTAGASLELGAWSASLLVVGADAPTVSVARPVSPLASAVVEVEWVTTQAQAYPQSQWQVSLLQGADVFEVLTGTGPDTAATFESRVFDGTYSVLVEVWCSGLPASASRAFTVALIRPALPIVSAVWDEEAGCTGVQVTPGAGGRATVRLDLERSIDGGPWVLVATDPAEIDVQDFESRSCGVTEYRATAWTDENCPADLLVESVADSSAVWLSTGAEFALTARLPWNPDYGVEAGRVRSTQQYAGRALPVAYSGESLSRQVKMSGLVLEDTDDSELSAYVDDLLELAQDASALHLIRDPQGRLIYGSLSAVSTDRDRGLGAWSYSFELTETEH